MVGSDSGSDGGANEDNVPFALTPAMAHEGIIDYTTARGRKMYAAATSKLSEDLYNCNAEDLYAFLKALRERAREYGWETPGVGIMSIPDNHVNPTDFKSLTDNHGEIDLESIREFGGILYTRKESVGTRCSNAHSLLEMTWVCFDLLS